ncbi:porin [Burkholderia orbicola]|uniref:porin n=1 Tax=Burkholderia orbicola TaxID=2978683 RepID=UPI0035C7364C
MKYPVAATILIGALTPECHAQSSIQMYGVIDAGLMYKTGADAAGKSLSQLVSGVEATNRWGLRGREDLGGGWAAIFSLESGFRVGTGMLIGSSQRQDSTVLFDRGATIGITNEQAGTVRFGRNWTPFYDAVFASDAAGWSNFGSLNNLSYQQRTGLPGAGYYWANNSVKYASPVFAGLSGSVLYSFGGHAGDFKNSRLYSAALVYRNGPVLLNAGYLDANDPTGATDSTVARAYHIGAMYSFGGLSRAGVSWTSFRDPAAGSKQGYLGATGTYGMTSTFALSGVYTHLFDHTVAAGHADMFKLAADCFLSKRTTVYADVGYARNGTGSTLGLQYTTPVAKPGKNQFAVAAGMRMTF